MGLFDAFLIKENHIAACGGIKQAVEEARWQQPGKTVEVEVENLEELKEALAAKVDVVMLDNFSNTAIAYAGRLKTAGTKYEISGGIDIGGLPGYIDQNIDFVSSGSLTKHLDSVDLSFSVTKVGKYE